eukprot:CAMPEP_0203756320 /NCGR_PEP_ID=MMETSP0098-20131031/9615_1 /ASSEMBLY_ACC=CAM_ASM_000208 /TAXON_ID=96639 /ORGANISM=" , Strain NY0313808BC1" /LENGTH=1878 /DNA_ID=CAMNT_0050648153 /DNA_START=134 /DNA_END=5767 /DNA_ORIENTATION=-
MSDDGAAGVDVDGGSGGLPGGQGGTETGVNGAQGVNDENEEDNEQDAELDFEKGFEPTLQEPDDDGAVGGDGEKNGGQPGLSEAGNETGDDSVPAQVGCTVENEPSGVKRKKPTFVLTSHNRADFTADLVLNSALFPEVKVGDYVKIYHPDTRKKQRLLLQVTSLDPIRGNIQVSVLKSITSNPAFHLQVFQPVIVKKTDARKHGLSYVEMSFKDQYVSQGEFWRFRDVMRGKCCYIGQKLSLFGINVSIDEMLGKGNKPIACGVVRPHTKFIFRSCSARLYWLVQLSKEMWNFSEDGDLYFERFLNRFATQVFEKWTSKGVTHRLTVVYFSRTYFNIMPPEGTPAVNIDYDGRYYTDLYHTIFENETRPNWSTLLMLLKRGFMNFPQIAGWKVPREKENVEFKRSSFSGMPQSPSMDMFMSKSGGSASNISSPLSSLSCGSESPRSAGDSSHGRFVLDSCNEEVCTDPNSSEGKCFGLPSTAQEGGCLEAINLCLNILDKHFMDRDFTRTGQAMVLVTAGTGVFEVGRTLTNITKQRMMDNAIGCDFVSLTRAPLHVAPLFVYKPSRNKSDVFDRPHPFAHKSMYRVHRRSSVSEFHTENGPDGNVSDNMSNVSSTPQQVTLPVFNIPHWIHLSFPYHKSVSMRPVIGQYEDHEISLDASNGPMDETYSSNAVLLRNQSRPIGVSLTGEQFEPLPFNRMFDLIDPTRSSLPVALMNQIYTGSKPTEAAAEDEEVVEGRRASFHLHRVPSREKMTPWLPLVITPFRTTPAAQNITLPLRNLSKGCSPTLNALRPALAQGIQKTDAQSRDDLYADDSVIASKVKNTKRGYDIRKVQSMQSFDFLGPSSTFAVPPRSPKEKRKLRGHGPIRGTSPSTIALPSAHWNSNPTQQLRVGGSGDSWSDRLVRNMEKHLEFDRSVFQRPLCAKYSKQATGKGSGKHSEISRRSKLSRSNSAARYLNSRVLSLRNSDPETKSSDLNTGSGSLTSIDSGSSTSRPSGEQCKGKIISFLEANQSCHTGSAPRMSSESLKTDNSFEIGVAEGVVRLGAHVGPKLISANTSELSSSSSFQHLTSTSSSLDQKNTLLPWDRRRAFGPGMKVNAPTECLPPELVAEAPDHESVNSSIVFSPVSVTENVVDTAGIELSMRRDSTGSIIENDLEFATQFTGAASPTKHSLSTIRQSPLMQSVSRTLQSKAKSFQNVGAAVTAFTRQTSGEVSNGSPGPAAAGPLLQGVSINPFDWSVFTSPLYQERLTHNRRRWSHLFPTGRFDNEGHGVRVEDFDEDDSDESIGSSEETDEDDEVVPLTIESFRLNWKSLQSPGILPLTTDYIPDRADLDINYQENFYSLTLPESPGDFGYATHEELIKEMVSQRLSQDFQLLVLKSAGESKPKGTVCQNIDNSTKQKDVSNQEKDKSDLLTGHLEDEEEEEDDDEDDEEEEDEEEEKMGHHQASLETLQQQLKKKEPSIDVGENGREQEGWWRNRLSSTALSKPGANTIVIKPTKKLARNGGVAKEQNAPPLLSRVPSSTSNSRLSSRMLVGQSQRQLSSSHRVTPKPSKMQTTYVLTMGHQIHQLEYDPETREVKVKRYVHHNFRPGVGNTVSYQYMLYDGAECSCAPVSLDFTDKSPFYNWNRLDYIVCGYHDDFVSTVRYRRIMFCLIPSVDSNTKRSPRRWGRRYASSEVTGTSPTPQKAGTTLQPVSPMFNESIPKLDADANFAETGSEITPENETQSEGTTRKLRRTGSVEVSATLFPFQSDAKILSKQSGVPTLVDCQSEHSSLADWNIHQITSAEEENKVAGFKKFITWLQLKVIDEDEIKVDIHRRFFYVPKEKVSLGPGQVWVKDAGDFSLIDDPSKMDPTPCRTRHAKIELQARNTGRYEW